MTAEEIHEKAEELHASWINGNRTHVAEELLELGAEPDGMVVALDLGALFMACSGEHDGAEFASLHALLHLMLNLLETPTRRTG